MKDNATNKKPESIYPLFLQRRREILCLLWSPFDDPNLTQQKYEIYLADIRYWSKEKQFNMPVKLKGKKNLTQDRCRNTVGQHHPTMLAQHVGCVWTPCTASSWNIVFPQLTQIPNKRTQHDGHKPVGAFVLALRISFKVKKIRKQHTIKQKATTDLKTNLFCSFQTLNTWAHTCSTEF